VVLLCACDDWLCDDITAWRDDRVMSWLAAIEWYVLSELATAKYQTRSTWSCQHSVSVSLQSSTVRGMREPHGQRTGRETYSTVAHATPSTAIPIGGREKDSQRLLNVWKCLYIGNRTYNSNHCMLGTRCAGRKNITSGTRRARRIIKRWESDV